MKQEGTTGTQPLDLHHPFGADQLNIEMRSVRDGFLRPDPLDDLWIANSAALGRNLACQASALVGVGGHCISSPLVVGNSGIWIF